MLTPEQASSFFPSASQSVAFASGSEPMIPRSGDKNFDIALAHTLAKASRILEVLPGFAYYDDYDGFNAFATSEVRLQRVDGTVLFGQGLLRHLMNQRENPSVGVAAVCAHEFGHILQFKRGLSDIVLRGQRTVKRLELQADYFAGYFAGIRKLERPTFPAAVVAVTQAGVGDDQVDHPQHHGTPQERGAAVVAGFKAAFDDKASLAEAITSSTSYVSSL